MIDKKIENIITKYLNKTANAAELDTLNKWIKDPSNQLIFSEYVKSQYAVNISMNEPDSSKIKGRLLKEIRKERSVFYKLRSSRVLRYAAVAVISLGMGYFLPKDFFKTETSNLAQVAKEEAITLQLEDGTVKVISEDGSFQVTDPSGNVIGQQKGNQLIYNSTNEPDGKLSYNTLNIPHGKKLDLLLSDGTIAHLNSGSSIRYPVKFLKEGNRQVYLTGEAFLDVAKDDYRLFIVNADQLNVRVLGTQFNVSSYPEDRSTEVVLVEGAVELYTEVIENDSDDTIILEPGFMGSYDREESRITTKLVNTKVYTSWMNGELVFRSMTFENIRKKLERYYNISIENRNAEIANEEFSGTFSNQPIEKVLEFFKVYHKIEFVIENDKVIIK